MKINYLTLFFLLLVFSSCSSSKSELNEDVVFRVNSLYEHSILMVELSSKEKLESLGLNGENLRRDSSLSPEDKVKILEEAYYMDLGDKKIEEKIGLLEEKMVELMENWRE